MTPDGWTIDLSNCPLGPSPDPATVDAATTVATEILWALSGRRFGYRDVTVRPTPPCPPGPSLVQAAFGHTHTGVLGPTILCCEPTGYINLAGPVASIIEVLIDGAVVDPTTYRLSGNRLWRRGAGLVWPTVQDMTLEPGLPGTWTVAYVQGQPVPAGGLYAAGQLACELYKAMMGKACALPQRVTEISREGVSMTVLDPAEFLDKGRTGISAVDLWIASVNPYGLPSATTVWSPDMPAAHPRV